MIYIIIFPSFLTLLGFHLLGFLSFLLFPGDVGEMALNRLQWLQSRI